MSNIGIFGSGDNALISIDLLQTNTFASINGTAKGAVATATQTIGNSHDFKRMNPRITS